jgi:hypothetical protein
MTIILNIEVVKKQFSYSFNTTLTLKTAKRRQAYHTVIQHN